LFSQNELLFVVLVVRRSSNNYQIFELVFFGEHKKLIYFFCLSLDFFGEHKKLIYFFCLSLDLFLCFIFS